MNKINNWWIKLSSLIAVGGAVGIGTFFIVDSFSHKTPREVVYAYEDTKILGDVPIAQEVSSDGSKVFNDEQMKTFIEKINTSLNFGPEMIGLHGIYINSDSQKAENEGEKGETLGYFRPSEAKIFLNGGATKIQELLDKGTEESINEVYDELLGTLWHEYGHYMANIYLNSYWNDNDTNIAKIYQASGINRKEYSTWNRDFLTRWESILEFDSPNTAMALTSRYNLDPTDTTNPVAPLIPDQTIFPLTDAYTYQDLFRLSNSQDPKDPVYSRLDNYNVGWVSKPLPYSHNKDYQVNGESLSYLFSMDELYTRVTQMISTPRWEWGNQDDWYTFGGKPFNYYDFNLKDSKVKELGELINEKLGNSIDDELSVIIVDSKNKVRIGGYSKNKLIAIENKNSDELVKIDDTREYRMDFYTSTAAIVQNDESGHNVRRVNYKEVKSAAKNPYWFISEPIDINKFKDAQELFGVWSTKDPKDETKTIKSSVSLTLKNPTDGDVTTKRHYWTNDAYRLTTDKDGKIFLEESKVSEVSNEE